MLWSFALRTELLSLGSAYRTCALAGTAVDASGSVDNVLAVTLGNSGNGASVSASAAADAIVGNLISHCEIPPRNSRDFCPSIINYIRNLF